jgi:hypothetical protein
MFLPFTNTVNVLTLLVGMLLTRWGDGKRQILDQGAIRRAIAVALS